MSVNIRDTPNRFAPSRLLTIIDLPQIQDLPLDYTLPVDSTTLNNAPITVFLAVFEAPFDP